MKVEGPKRTQESSATKKKGGVSGADGSFGDLISEGAAEAQKAAASQSIARVDALLTVQGTEDPTERAARRRMTQRSDTLLKELDKIRMSMLGGTLTVGHMVDIADVVASHREKIADPQLTSILDEIDLRAQVELAKMRLGLDQSSSV